MDTQVVDKRAEKQQECRKNKKQVTPVTQLTREELEARLMQVEAHNKQLQNLLAKCQGATDETKRPRKERPFDFKKHSKRHILLKFAYLGWDYQGFAVQEDTQQTIEAHLFTAFLKTRLIESRETSNYHRCGRTDKGVSAFDQVISITLRSNLKSGVGVVKDSDDATEMLDDSDKDREISSDDSQEINYVILLNKVLPPEIRMLAWCPVALGYSARFDCSYRTYKYFFPRGNLDIKLMNEAAQHLVGCHDYRNFCKMDVGNGVVNYSRRIMAVNVCDLSEDVRNRTVLDTEALKKINNDSVSNEDKMEADANWEQNRDSHKSQDSDNLVSSNCQIESGSGHSLDGYDMCVATIEGQAFLWHQVRAIMAILFLVGSRKEVPGIIQELLNVEKHPRKPQYCLASDFPLNLYQTTFDGVAWHWDNKVLRSVVSQLQALWTQYSVRTTMIRRMLYDLEARINCWEDENSTEPSVTNSLSEGTDGAGVNVQDQPTPQDQSESLVPGSKTKVYRPLLSRPTCESLERRVEHYVKRQKLDQDILLKLRPSDVEIESFSEDSLKNKYKS